MKRIYKVTLALIASVTLISSLAERVNAAIISLGTFEGKDYFYDTGNYLSQNDAQMAASVLGKELVSITSEAESSFLVSAITPIIESNLRAAWIGLARENRSDPFEWISGEALTYTNWRPAGVGHLFSEPTGERAGVIYVNSPVGIPVGLWADTFAFGSEPFNAVFESESVSTPEPSAIFAIVSFVLTGAMLKRSKGDLN
ncbi:MAG: hypothetical protein F6J87_31020 [Spirulina sp. SIO3F2]|nr:hypothetical protein [Spirulina sp. SIO3F2]